jgi:hypothetical protein
VKAVSISRVTVIGNRNYIGADVLNLEGICWRYLTCDLDLVTD